MSGTWVLLRGLTREQGHWGGFIPALAQALPPGCTLLSPDLPGNGTLHAQASPDSVQGMVLAVRGALASQGHAPPYHLLAMSLGAMVAIEWAHLHPEEVGACVLINTSVRPFSRFWERLRPVNYLRILRLALARPDPLILERAVMRMTTRHPPAPDATLAHWVALRQRHPVTLPNAWRQLRAAIRYRAPDQAPAVPLLVLYSGADGLVNPRCSEALIRRWGAPSQRHPTAGHDLPLDDAAWVTQQVLTWLICQKLDGPS
ncbi:alpha/beta hydrolase [Aquabacterium soli]|uniref:Alpha/beta hydrolase n=1 Tax=Aquabacterium soli TaxID=2493092 RepID=A0A3R8YLH6_9BURK|nr:alpha/beta hydrolase [Aquabacterium soli]RRS03153.1 alpha/beta hydrolase [Aquabacterium soli]